MPNLSKRFWRDKTGTTTIEYGLITAIIGVGVVLSLTNMVTSLTNLFGLVEQHIPD